MADIFGTEENDTLIGTPEPDLILGADGFDSIIGAQGNDTINGNLGNDTIKGGEGNDLLRGGQDNDQIFGDVGEDTLFGDFGNDTVLGGEGRDLIFGERGDDLLFGNASDDEINGSEGNDTISGGDGNDVLRGGKDNDSLSGEIGNDFLYGDKGIDTLTGGDGNEIFFLRKELGGATLAEADIITDFVNGADKVGLIEGLTFAALNIFQGTGDNAADTIIQDSQNQQFLAVLQGVERSTIDAADFIAPGTLAFSAATFQVNEDGTTEAAVTITRTNGSDGAVSVTVTPTNGKALAPDDYDNTPIVLNFAAGETSKTVTIGIVNDTLLEPNETLNLSLSNATGSAQIGAQNQAVLEIVTDDSPIPKLTFRNPNPDDGNIINYADNFGISVAALGNNVLIGARGENTGADGAGAAYLFDGTTGALLQTFGNPTPEFSDFFGFSVAAVGNNVLIGAPGEVMGAIRAGAAYLFDGTTGALLQTFGNPTPNEGDNFGSRIATVGNNVLIGAPGGGGTLAPSAGAAYLFDGTTGALLQTFGNPTPNELDLFGFSVAAVGNNVLIGAPNDNTDATRAGAAYLFDGTTGALLQTFRNPTPNEGDFFGNSIAAVGNNVLIGASNDNTGATAAGAAYLFDGTTGALLQTFRNPTPNAFDFFGSVAAVGNNVVIGAPDDDTVALTAGAAYLFDGTTGALLETFLNPTPNELDLFGLLVTTVGNNVLIGAPSAEGGGAVYLF